MTGRIQDIVRSTPSLKVPITNRNPISGAFVFVSFDAYL